jgi:uncharacterized repeat protein (TIGR02059 family)
MKTTFFLIFLALSSFASATDYYFKNGGNDLGSGTSDETAWATIEKVNSIFPSLIPGDRILFRRGDTFYGTIKITKSGAAGSLITLGAYGTGEKPIITGFTRITSWSNEGNGVYSASFTSDALTNMVIIDGVQYAMGRWPDNTYNIFESASTNISITDNDLGTATDWTGAEVVIRKNDHSLDRCKITDHTGNKLIYTSLSTTQNAFPGYGYFIQNDIRTLSAYGEWYHDTRSGRLYIYFGSVDPSIRVVEIAALNNLVLNDTFDYITLDNINFKGSISHALAYLNYGCNFCTIQNCSISYAGLDGIHFLGDHGTINNNIISSCNQAGILSVGNYVKITSNSIQNIGTIPGQAMDGSLTNGIHITNNDCILQNNNIENVGYCGITLSSSADIITIKNNFINNVCTVLNDGGGIYTAREGVSRYIDGNIILNVLGNTSGTPYPDRPIARGIYLDYNSTNVIVTNNTVANCSEGGYMIHQAYDNRLENNTAFNNGYGMFFQNAYENSIRNNVLQNNIFIAKAASQLALKFYSGADNIPSFGTADNNCYARPVDDDDVFQTYSPSTGSMNRTLAGWQAFTNQDLSSFKSPVTVTDIDNIDFYYNATISNSVISLSEPMIDVRGNKYSGSVTLLPYTSIILMPDPNPSQPVVPVFSGALIESAAPSVLVMTYSASLAAVTPSTTSFTVTINGSNRPVTSVSVSGNKVSLTLESQVVYGDVITVAYTKPSTNLLQSTSEGQAASLSAQSVKNNCSAPANKPPVVIISSPAKGSSYTSPAQVAIDIEAFDPDGTISMVELFNGTVKLGERTAAPYSFNLKDLEEGVYSLHAVATDNLKSATTSASLVFHVTSFNENGEFFNLYPNPNDGRFSINFISPLEAENYTVTIFNIIGRTVFRIELSKEQNIQQFDLSHLNPGIYVIMISTKEILLTQKFIKG